MSSFRLVKRYRVLVADPPWPFRDGLPRQRGARYHYRTMLLKNIEWFPLPPMTEDATLFLWRVSAMQQEALNVLRAWDFTLKSELVWRKRTKYNKRWFGMGRTVRAEHETCLIAHRGRPRTLDRSIRSIFSAPVIQHSQKPELFYDLVERLREGPYVELFARRQRRGWDCYGDELTRSTS